MGTIEAVIFEVVEAVGSKYARDAWGRYTLCRTHVDKIF